MRPTTSVTVPRVKEPWYSTMVVDSADVNGLGFQLTADEMLTASVSRNQKGNRWSVSVNWSLSTAPGRTRPCRIDAPATTFRPVLASSDAHAHGHLRAG